MSEVGAFLSEDDWEAIGRYYSVEQIEARALEKIILQALFIVTADECGEYLRQEFTRFVQVRRQDRLQREAWHAAMAPREAERQAIQNDEMRRRLRHMPHAADPGASDEEIVAEAEIIEARQYLKG